MSFFRCIVNVMILSLAVTAADAGSRVEAVGDKCILVDGRPFFPVGIYAASVDDFPKLADAGFNLVHTYGWEGISGHEWGKDIFAKGRASSSEPPADIHETENDQLYKTHRYFVYAQGYHIPIPRGKYRVALHFAIHTLPQALTIKRGGHDDQLSQQWGLDRYRIRALEKIMQTNTLTVRQRELISRDICRRSRILVQGYRKRGDEKQVYYYQKLLSAYQP